MKVNALVLLGFATGPRGQAAGSRYSFDRTQDYIAASARAWFCGNAPTNI